MLESWSTQTIDLGGWTLCDVARHCLRFPAGAILPDGGQVVVYTGEGMCHCEPSRPDMFQHRAVA